MGFDHLPLFIAFGFALSAYAYYVEFKVEESKRLGSKYTAACDIGIFSCTKVFSSEFGHLTHFFGLPKYSNAAVGMSFYALIFLLLLITNMTSNKNLKPAKGTFWDTALSLQPNIRGTLLSILLLIGIASAIASCGLFTILTVFLHDLCIVCCSIYVVNFVFLFTAWSRYKKYVVHRLALGERAADITTDSLAINHEYILRPFSQSNNSTQEKHSTDATTTTAPNTSPKPLSTLFSIAYATGGSPAQSFAIPTSTGALPRKPFLNKLDSENESTSHPLSRNNTDTAVVFSPNYKESSSSTIGYPCNYACTTAAPTPVTSVTNGPPHKSKTEKNQQFHVSVSQSNSELPTAAKNSKATKKKNPSSSSDPKKNRARSHSNPLLQNIFSFKTSTSSYPSISGAFHPLIFITRLISVVGAIFSSLKSSVTNTEALSCPTSLTSPNATTLPKNINRPPPINPKKKEMKGISIDHLPMVIAFGFTLAAYAYYVEYKLEESKRLGSKYVAACDIGIFSCTKVFSSEFGYMTQFFGLPKISNALVGMAYYAFVFILHLLTTFPSLSKKSAASGKPFWPTLFSIQPEPRGIILSMLAAIGVAGALVSCALFYILTVKMHDLCIVCCSIYVTNFTMLFTTVPRYVRYVRRRAANQPGSTDVSKWPV